MQHSRPISHVLYVDARQALLKERQLQRLQDKCLQQLGLDLAAQQADTTSDVIEDDAAESDV